MGLIIFNPLSLILKNIWQIQLLMSLIVFVSLFVSLFFIVKSSKESPELKTKGVLYTCIAASILRISGLAGAKNTAEIAGMIISIALFYLVYILITKKIKTTVQVQK
jgi:hypothetical protein